MVKPIESCQNSVALMQITKPIIKISFALIGEIDAYSTNKSSYFFND